MRWGIYYLRMNPSDIYGLNIILFAAAIGFLAWNDQILLLPFAALLAWAGLREARQVDYHARRERDIERLADLVEAHLDTARLRALCGLA